MMNYLDWQHGIKHENKEMTSKNKECLDQFTVTVTEYLENNTIEDLCKLIFKKIPKSMIYRIISKIKRIDN